MGVLKRSLSNPLRWNRYIAFQHSTPATRWHVPHYWLLTGVKLFLNIFIYSILQAQTDILVYCIVSPVTFVFGAKQYSGWTDPDTNREQQLLLWAADVLLLLPGRFRQGDGTRFQLSSGRTQYSLSNPSNSNTQEINETHKIHKKYDFFFPF